MTSCHVLRELLILNMMPSVSGLPPGASSVQLPLAGAEALCRVSSHARRVGPMKRVASWLLVLCAGVEGASIVVAKARRGKHIPRLQELEHVMLGARVLKPHARP